MDEWSTFYANQGQPLEEEEASNRDDTQVLIDSAGLDVSIDALTKAYDLILEQLRSTQNRCGVAIGVSLTAGGAFIRRFYSGYDLFAAEGLTKNFYSLQFLGFFFLISAFLLFAVGFIEDHDHLPMNLENMRRGLWQEPKEFVQRYRLQWLDLAFAQAVVRCGDKKGQLTAGTFLFSLSMLVFFSIEAARFSFNP